MTFFPEPLKPSKDRRDNPIAISPIEGRKGREYSGNRRPPQKKPPFFALFLILIGKALGALFQGRGNRLNKFLYDACKLDVEHLRDLLASLKKEDLSENARFCRTFSQLWHRLIRHIQLAKRKRGSHYIDIPTLQALIDEMEHFPQWESHKLGYYLSEYSGEKWLPIPFRDILVQLHAEYASNPKGSTLEKWTRSIEELLVSTRPWRGRKMR